MTKYSKKLYKIGNIELLYILFLVGLEQLPDKRFTFNTTVLDIFDISAVVMCGTIARDLKGKVTEASAFHFKCSYANVKLKFGLPLLLGGEVHPCCRDL